MADKSIAPFVYVALKVQEDLHITDKGGKMATMRFAKLYSPEKMGKIRDRAVSYFWAERSPTAAFLRAVKEINYEESKIN